MVIFNILKSSLFKITREIKQVEPLSLILFSIYIDKLGEMLNKLGTGIKIDLITYFVLMMCYL